MDIYVIVGMIMASMEKQVNTSVIARVLGMKKRSVVDFGEILYILLVCSSDFHVQQNLISLTITV